MERKHREFEIWVAELGGALAGWGAIGDNYLEGLYTAPEFAGRGVGGSLLTWLEGLLRDRGIQAVRADASSNARDFYLRRGYRLSGPRTAVGAWPIDEAASIADCNRPKAEVLAEVSASSLSRSRRLIFPAQEATLAAELTGRRGPQSWLLWRIWRGRSGA